MLGAVKVVLGRRVAFVQEIIAGGGAAFDELHPASGTMIVIPRRAVGTIRLPLEAHALQVRLSAETFQSPVFCHACEINSDGPPSLV